MPHSFTVPITVIARSGLVHIPAIPLTTQLLEATVPREVVGLWIRAVDLPMGPELGDKMVIRGQQYTVVGLPEREHLLGIPVWLRTSG